MTTRNSHQISVRIDSDLCSELLFIENSLKMNLSEAIKDAIHWRYTYLKNLKKKPSPKEVLEKSGFIGCMSRSTEGSSNYKMAVTKRLKSKHG